MATFSATLLTVCKWTFMLCGMVCIASDARKGRSQYRIAQLGLLALILAVPAAGLYLATH